MAKKKNKNNNNNNQNPNPNPNQNQKTNETEAKNEEVVTEKEVVAEEKKDNGGGEKKNEDSNSVTAVYKIPMHCEGCTTKIRRCVKDFQGVEDVKAEVALNKLTVIGKVDPTTVRDMLSQKTKRHVEILPPIPKKEKDGGGSSREDIDKKDGNGGGSGGGKKKGGGGDGGQEEGGDGGGGEKRMDVFRHPGFGYYDHGYGYGNGFVNGYGHANGWTRGGGTCNMHQICSVKKTQMLALSCEEGKTVF